MLMEIRNDSLRVQSMSIEADANSSDQRIGRSVQTLRDEVVARWGYVVLADDSACLNLEGAEYALELRVDLEDCGIGLGIEDGIWLAEHLRGVGRRTGRFSHLIHRGQIAGKFSGWRWGKYRGFGATMDRIHLSVCDARQGEPSLLDPEVYNSIEPWGIKAA